MSATSFHECVILFTRALQRSYPRTGGTFLSSAHIIIPTLSSLAAVNLQYCDMCFQCSCTVVNLMPHIFYVLQFMAGLVKAFKTFKEHSELDKLTLSRTLPPVQCS